MGDVDLSRPWLDAGHIAVDPRDGASWHDGVIRTAAITGEAPYTLVRTFITGDQGVTDVGALVPDHMSVIADSVSDGLRVLLLADTDVVASLTLGGSHVSVYGAAVSAARRDALHDFYQDLFPPEPVDANTVRVEFVHC